LNDPIFQQAAVSRLGKPLPGRAWIAGTALTVSTAAILAYVIGVVIQVNGMMTVGLVQLPGMMTGQILAGSSSCSPRAPRWARCSLRPHGR
jgi:hypothetical protein